MNVPELLWNSVVNPIVPCIRVKVVRGSENPLAPTLLTLAKSNPRQFPILHQVDVSKATLEDTHPTKETSEQILIPTEDIDEMQSQ